MVIEFSGLFRWAGKHRHMCYRKIGNSGNKVIVTEKSERRKGKWGVKLLGSIFGPKDTQNKTCHYADLEF